MVQLHFSAVPWREEFDRNQRIKQGKAVGPALVEKCHVCKVEWPCTTIKQLAEHFCEIEGNPSNDVVRVADSEFRSLKNMI